MYYSSYCLHPARPMNDIWDVQFIVVDTVGKRFLAGDKQM